MASIFNTIEVITGRTARILNFLESADEFYIAIGKDTPWDGSFGLNISDINPPEPPIDATMILDPIIYKKLDIGTPGSTAVVKAASINSQCSEITSNEEVVSAVVLVQQTIAQQNYTLFDAADIVNDDGTFSKNPDFVYVSGEILGTDYTASNWRSSALYTKLFLEDGVPTGQIIYTPNQVKGGLLHHLTYNTPVERQDDKRHKFEYLITV